MFPLLSRAARQVELRIATARPIMSTLHAVRASGRPALSLSACQPAPPPPLEMGKHHCGARRAGARCRSSERRRLAQDSSSLLARRSAEASESHCRAHARRHHAAGSAYQPQAIAPHVPPVADASIVRSARGEVCSKSDRMAAGTHQVQQRLLRVGRSVVRVEVGHRIDCGRKAGPYRRRERALSIVVC